MTDKFNELEVLHLFSTLRKWQDVARHLEVSVSQLTKWKRKVKFESRYNPIKDITHEELVLQIRREKLIQEGVHLDLYYFRKLFTQGCFTVPRSKISAAFHSVAAEPTLEMNEAAPEVSAISVLVEQPVPAPQAPPFVPPFVPSEPSTAPQLPHHQPAAETELVYAYVDLDLVFPRNSSSAPCLPVGEWAPRSLLAEGWTTEGHLIGTKIMKSFESPTFPFGLNSFTGYVVAFLPATSTAPELYKVLYQDDDREDFERHELDLFLPNNVEN